MKLNKGRLATLILCDQKGNSSGTPKLPNWTTKDKNANETEKTIFVLETSKGQIVTS
jgi:hypothetical protein